MTTLTLAEQIFAQCMAQKIAADSPLTLSRPDYVNLASDAARNVARSSIEVAKTFYRTVDSCGLLPQSPN